MIARYLMASLLACAAWLPLQAQPTLADLVSQADAEWMLGKWEAQLDNGGSVTLEVSWDLDKHVIVQHGKINDLEFKSYTVLEPGVPAPKYVSFDTRGSVGKGSWAMEDGNLTLRVENNSPERGISKMAVIYTGSASEGLEVRLHRLTDSGELESPAGMTVKFKKQK